MNSFFDYISTPIGPVLYRWSESGVSSVTICPEEHELVGETLPYKDLTEKFEEYFSGSPVDFTGVKLDLSDTTDFQYKVLMACRKLLYGKTSTYTDLAKTIGNEEAKRAVGTALSKNPIPIIIPCHRIKAKADIGGFSGGEGVATKKFLLELESGQRFMF